MVVNIDAKLLEAIQGSTCFGIAYAEDVPECKQCDVRGSCKSKVGGIPIPTPTTKPASTKKPETKVAETKTKQPTKPVSKPAPKPSTPVSKPKAKSDKPTNSNAPDFKDYTLEQLVELAEQRKVDWKDYGNDNITRMRLIMALKKSY